jgi:hypothetical protein
MPDLRRILAAAALGLLWPLLAPPVSPASPQFTQTFELGFAARGHTVRAPGAPTGFTTTMEANDPGEPNSMPRRVARLEIAFPAGTRFDTATLARCSAATIQLRGAGACPPGSRLGGGTATVRTGQAPPGTPEGEFTESVALYNSARGIVFVFSGPATVVLDAKLNGRTLAFDVPPAPFALSRLDLRIGPHRRWAVTPRACSPKRGWTVRAKFAYTDGSSLSREGTTPCSRR